MCSLAKEFETLVRSDERFEIFTPVQLGLVCFRLKVYYLIQLHSFKDLHCNHVLRVKNHIN